MGAVNWAVTPATPERHYQGPGYVVGETLYSDVIRTTAPTPVVQVPAGQGVSIETGTLCNTDSTTVHVSLSVLDAGQEDDGTHRMIDRYPLAADNTLSLHAFLVGAVLGEGQAVNVTVDVPNVLVVVLSGLRARD